MPVILSDRRYAVVRNAPDSAWVIGTTGFTVGSNVPGNIDLVASSVYATRGPEVIRYRLYPNGDLRDLLDESIDVVVTRRHDVIGYSNRLSNYVRHPLPWNRTYVLLTGSTPPEEAQVDSGKYVDFLTGLARDAVREEARPHEAPTWWPVDGCNEIPQSEGPVAIDRISYVLGDPVAKDLAERLTFLASSPEPLPGFLAHLSGATATNPVAASEIAALLADAGSVALIASVDRFSREPCGLTNAFRSIRTSAIPLIDTRNEMIIRIGTTGMTVFGDGTPSFRLPN